ncbi:MAG TPA: thiamine-phosphate kinase [Abditibacteriaceae bacterium]|jgi:thiamine-monophosphate kinase
MNLASLGEFGLIGRLRNSLALRPGVQLGIGDDAAVLESITSPIVTCDALIEGIHFRLDWTGLRDLGWKSLAVNLSDIAAMGGTPIAAFVALALPSHFTVEQVEEIYKGMEECAREFAFTIAGGDTTKSPGPLMISVTLIGNTPHPILRSGAQVGDVLLVTGTLGDAAAALECLQNSQPAPDEILQKHHRPSPRLREMHAALQIPNAVRAALDLSDGLAGDAAHIAHASDVTLEIETDLLPISQACRAIAEIQNNTPLDWALRSGEDYELLLCVAPEQAQAVQNAIEQTGTSCTVIGRVLPRESAPVMLKSKEMRESARGGFAHF